MSPDPAKAVGGNVSVGGDVREESKATPKTAGTNRYPGQQKHPAHSLAVATKHTDTFNRHPLVQINPFPSKRKAATDVIREMYQEGLNRKRRKTMESVNQVCQVTTLSSQLFLSHSAVSFLRWWKEAAHEVCQTSDNFDDLINPDPATATLLSRREKDWLDSFLEVLCRDSDSLRSTAEAIVGILRQRPLSHTPEWNGNRIFSASENHTDLLPPLSADEYLVASREQYKIEIWALKFQRNYQVFRQARQQMERILLGIPPVNALEILSDLEYTQMVLLSSATTVNPSTNSLKTRDWTKDEKARFCSKFTSFISGPWSKSDILNSWEKLVQVS